MTIHGANEGEIDYDAGEPDWDSLKEVCFACGHRCLSDQSDPDPGPETLCPNCRPCPACGERWQDCSCPVQDPFAEESETEARARMTPAEAEADRQWVRPEGRCGVCGEDLQPSERMVCDFCKEKPMRTIRRNAKRHIGAIFDKAITCKVYTLGNGFSGCDCRSAVALENYNRYEFARLYETGDGKYTLHVHSNHFYELRLA